MRVLLIEPYYGGSHRAWADGYHRFSAHNVSLLTLPAQFWKWRMQGGAVTLARLMKSLPAPDVILASDMMDLSTFRALSAQRIPTALYFHESQLTYPQNRRQRHGWQYAFINYSSALCADAVFFNSDYHQNVFFDEVPRMLKHFGDYNELDTVAEIRQKSSVLSLGLDLKRYDAHRPSTEGTGAPPLIVWNHRWEADKNPKPFLKTLLKLAKEGVSFRVALVGENFRQDPIEFEHARDQLGDRVVKYGFVESFAEYAALLWQAHYVVSTAKQDFFGGAVVEAMYCACVPLLPRRLHYPWLVPDDLQTACLFRGDQGLLPLLRRHLLGEMNVDGFSLRQHIASYDWSQMAPRYDEALSKLLPAQALQKGADTSLP